MYTKKSIFRYCYMDQPWRSLQQKKFKKIALPQFISSIRVKNNFRILVKVKEFNFSNSAILLQTFRAFLQLLHRQTLG